MLGPSKEARLAGAESMSMRKQRADTAKWSQIMSDLVDFYFSERWEPLKSLELRSELIYVLKDDSVCPVGSRL